jgi:hypothetical protein
MKRKKEEARSSTAVEKSETTRTGTSAAALRQVQPKI